MEPVRVFFIYALRMLPESEVYIFSIFGRSVLKPIQRLMWSADEQVITKVLVTTREIINSLILQSHIIKSKNHPDSKSFRTCNIGSGNIYYLRPEMWVWGGWCRWWAGRLVNLWHILSSCFPSSIVYSRCNEQIKLPPSDTKPMTSATLLPEPIGHELQGRSISMWVFFYFYEYLYE